MAKQKPKKKKPGTNAVATLRTCLTVAAELAGIAGFLLVLYMFMKEG
jgi:hypothetical protein